MSKRTFFVKAIWDEKERIFHSESDIKGLCIVTKTLEEFEEALSECALDLILANHLKQDTLMGLPFRDLLPIIMFEAQAEGATKAASRSAEKRRKFTPRRAFFVKALWDEEAQVFYSESNVDGLHVATETLEEFEEVVAHFALDVILANHIGQEKLADAPLRDLLPIVLFEKQATKATKAAQATKAKATKTAEAAEAAA